jgi:hypothetical protein
MSLITTQFRKAQPGSISVVRDTYVEWLVDHVGPAIQIPRNFRYCSEAGFQEMLDPYIAATSSSWKHVAAINHIFIIEGTNWTIWQVKAEDEEGYALYQHAIEIDDTLLAIQFKLACI